MIEFIAAAAARVPFRAHEMGADLPDRPTPQDYPYVVLWSDLGLEFSAAHNSGSADVPYFNPAAEFGVLPSLSLSHSLYRRYQTAWSHQLQLGLGSNSQRDYGSAH